MGKTVEDIIHKAIKRHAGLSDWDDGPIAAEVRDILRALKREGLVIVQHRAEHRCDCDLGELCTQCIKGDG